MLLCHRLVALGLVENELYVEIGGMHGNAAAT